MALFGGDKKKAAEDKLLNAFKSSIVTKNFFEYTDYAFSEKGNEWLSDPQSYYDSRKREVNFGTDLFEIKWYDTHNESYYAGDRIATRSVEDLFGRIAVSYTASGYKPLHSSRADGIVITEARVVDLWAEFVINRLKEKYPNLDFGPVMQIKGSNYRSIYRVPEMSLNDWFTDDCSPCRANDVIEITNTEEIAVPEPIENSISKNVNNNPFGNQRQDAVQYILKHESETE